MAGSDSALYIAEAVTDLLPHTLYYDDTWNATRLTCRRKGLNMNMHSCRRIFARHLSACGIQSEVIDFLQGSTTGSVFPKHYLTPNEDLKDRILKAVDELASKL